ncbi:hypothetical protein HMPREF3226_02529 [Prevotella corporis]|uniref:Uncharacterized protein n=1 Tax=Prevotella corporis TaxID=28128 RepID=A0A133PV74_9BACT|nr:hypothetical protein HMPREF3226_02529 [Prevotella corporis]
MHTKNANKSLFTVLMNVFYIVSRAIFVFRTTILFNFKDSKVSKCTAGCRTTRKLWNLIM